MIGKYMIHALIAVSATLALLHFAVAQQPCAPVSSLVAGVFCASSWATIKPLIKPVQSELGYAYVLDLATNYPSAANMTSYISTLQNFTAVVDDTNNLWMLQTNLAGSFSKTCGYPNVDAYSAMTALDYIASFSATSAAASTIMTIFITATFTDHTAFVNYMTTNTLMYLGALQTGSSNIQNGVTTTVAFSNSSIGLPSSFSLTPASQKFLTTLGCRSPINRITMELSLATVHPELLYALL